MLLYLIVREWLESTKRQPVYEVKNRSDLSQLQQTLITLEGMLNLVADCLGKETD